MTGTLEFDQNPDLIRELENGPEWREVLQAAADFGADYWTEHSRRRTGLMATEVDAYVEDSVGQPHAVVHATVHYAPYQEFGTQYITGQHVMAAMIPEIEVHFGG